MTGWNPRAIGFWGSSFSPRVTVETMSGRRLKHWDSFWQAVSMACGVALVTEVTNEKRARVNFWRASSAFTSSSLASTLLDRTCFRSAPVRSSASLRAAPTEGSPASVVAIPREMPCWSSMAYTPLREMQSLMCSTILMTAWEKERRARDSREPLSCR